MYKSLCKLFWLMRETCFWLYLIAINVLLGKQTIKLILFTQKCEHTFCIQYYYIISVPYLLWL